MADLSFLETAEEDQGVIAGYITSDGKFLTSEAIIQELSDSVINARSRLDKVSDQLEEAVKGITGSNQSNSELSHSSFASISGMTVQGQTEVVEPPYSVEVMQDLLEIEETHTRSCRTKAIDSVGRGYRLKNSVPVVLNETPPANTDEFITPEEYSKQLNSVKKFIRDCNENVQFEGVLELAAMDYEAFGWCAIEVIRGIDKKVKKLTHIPASRIKPMIGWVGFVEQGEIDATKTYYQPFGEKLKRVVVDEILGEQVVEFDPDEVDISDSSVKFNLVSRVDGTRTDNFSESANEVVWIKNHHPNTVYYGYCDAVPAIGAIIGNSKIRQYFLQFFENNAVPRWAVVIKGVKMTGEVLKLIHDYFSTQVRHNTYAPLILNIPSNRGEVVVEFQQLDTAQKEGDFLKTQDSNRQCIMTAHGVSGAIIGVTDGAELGAGKGTSQAEIYKDRIVIPRQKKWETVLLNIFRKGLGVKHVKIEFNPLDTSDRESQMRILTGYQLGGVVSVNQIREQIGEPPTEGGDRLFIRTQGGNIAFIDGFDDAGTVLATQPDTQTETITESTTESTETPV
jgi:capsid portal protein